MNNESGFPKFTPAQRTGSVGITVVTKLVESELKWRFRRNHQEDDFGIDGYIDIIQDDGAVLGTTLAVQVKTGPSHVTKKCDEGIVLHGELKHLNYFLNAPMPVLLVWVDEATEQAWWVHVAAHAIRMTKTGWSILIPTRNKLLRDNANPLAELAGPTTDYIPLVARLTAIRNTACQSERVVFVVGRDEVETGKTQRLRDFFRMFEAAPDVLPDIRHKLILLIHGWDDDPREVYEIPEIRAWFKEAETQIDGWSYFLDLKSRYSTLSVFMFCTCKVETRGASVDGTRKFVSIPPDERVNFLRRQFHLLNLFTERLGLSDAVNEEISDAITDLAIGSIAKKLRER